VRGVERAGAEAGERLAFVAADLENDAGWPEAVAGCDYVLHVASPQRDRLDGSAWRRRVALCEVQDFGGARSLGFYWQRRPQAEAFRDQSGGCVWSGAGAGLCDVHSDCAQDDGRSDAGCTVDLFRCGGCALRATTNPAAKGQRFLVVAGDFVSMLDIAKMLKSRTGASETAHATIA